MIAGMPPNIQTDKNLFALRNAPKSFIIKMVLTINISPIRAGREK